MNMAFWKSNKNREERNTISKTQHSYNEQISKRVSVQSTICYTSSSNNFSSSSKSGTNPTGSLPQLNSNFLASTFLSNLPDSRLNTDARPVNLNYQSPYRNSPQYRSLQIPKSITSTNYTTTGRPYSKPPPSPTVSIPTKNEPNKKIVVKKTGKFYDGPSSTIPTYSTHSKNRGEVLIINNVMFKDKGYRLGADVDGAKLKDLFKQMGFNVHVRFDLDTSKMKSEVKSFSKNRSLKKADIAVVVIMSHGTKNQKLGGTEIFGLDEKGVLVDDLIDFFNEKECESMRNKPKIFIFQCCRGDNEYFLRVQKDATPLKVTEKVVTNALIAYSSLPGFVSHRDPERGTWYISTLCDVFSEHAHEHHVEDLLKIVDKKLDDFDPNIKQSTNYENRGFKRCYLHPV